MSAYLKKILFLVGVVAILSGCQRGPGALDRDLEILRRNTSGGSGEIFGGTNPDQALLDRILVDIVEPSVASIAGGASFACNLDAQCANKQDPLCTNRPALTTAEQEQECQIFLRRNAQELLGLVRSNGINVVPSGTAIFVDGQPKTAKTSLASTGDIYIDLDLARNQLLTEFELAAVIVHEYVHKLRYAGFPHEFLDDETSFPPFTQAETLLNAVGTLVALHAKELLALKRPGIVLVSGANGRIQTLDGRTQAVTAHRFQDLLAFNTTRAPIATGDVNGDGIADLIVSSGTQSKVKVFDGATQSLLREYASYGPDSLVAAGDVNRDGKDDVIIASPAGVSAFVKIYDNFSTNVLAEIEPFPGFTGGVNVAAGDMNKDGRAEIIMGAGPGGGPHVRVWNSQSGFSTLFNFMAYNTGFAGGVFVAAGDLTGDGRADIITGAGPGGGPHVRVFDGETGAELYSAFPYQHGWRGGVAVAAGDVDGDGKREVIVAPHTLGTGLPVRAFHHDSNRTVFSFTPNQADDATNWVTFLR